METFEQTIDRADRQTAQALKYSSALRCTIIQLPTGDFALFSGAGTELLGIGSWADLEGLYHARPAPQPPQPRSTSPFPPAARTKAAKKENTARLLAELGL